jgi:phosphopantothenoylcysteine synthetase/decarboxylase
VAGKNVVTLAMPKQQRADKTQFIKNRLEVYS